MNCHVCAQPIDGGVVAVEVVELGRSRAVVWGPVPAHEGCDRAVVTPFDDRLGSTFVRSSYVLDAVPPNNGLGLHAIS
jgi:hypothetical protein